MKSCRTCRFRIEDGDGQASVACGLCADGELWEKNNDRNGDGRGTTENTGNRAEKKDGRYPKKTGIGKRGRDLPVFPGKEGGRI